MKFKVVATDGLSPEGAEVLRARPDVVLDVRSSTPAEGLNAALAEADFVIVRSATKITGAVLAACPQLKGVVRAGVGIDNIDLKAAGEKGVWVWNAPTGNFQATAELALGLLFAAARGIARATEGARTGKWMKKELSEGRQLSGSTLGIYGAGNIGLRVAHMARGIGMRVLICDPVFKHSAEQPYESVPFETLLKNSDFITIHAPLLDSTRGMFNASAFAQMKKGAILVNAARGGIIQEADLLGALESGQLAGVALDVFETEPFTADHPVYAKLLAHPRVVATPHVGASTVESQRLVSIESGEKILAAIDAAQGKGTAPKALNAPASARLRLA